MSSEHAVPYPAGLILEGRRVVVVGGGRVAQRRVPALIAAGALVEVVSPSLTPALEGLLGSGEITWRSERFTADVLDGAWYVIAATQNADVNEEVSAAAEERRIFCVRSDDGTQATAWTPATGHDGDLTIAVLANRDPRRSAGVRDRILDGLRSGDLIAPHERQRVPGVTLIGGGPGHPGLISVAGRKALMEADIVVADRLAPRELLSELPADVELVDVAKLPRGRSAQQEEINRIIVEAAKEGKAVARFKGGDNFIFGRGFEEVLACREAGVPVHVIPGLTSPVTVPGVAGIPVTHRGVAHEFTVISGHVPPADPTSLTNWSAVAQLGGTLVLLMAVQNAPAIATALMDGGRAASTPVAVICDGTMPTQRTVLATLETLEKTLADENVQPPAIIVIGEVVRVAHPDAF
ncbi:uroporphyrinogen-III C-methyltransferase [Nocardioides sp. NPDC057772]|uniref:uroporphyrinogen-III C-methyltransferase n=1 Tax=Nocardioides sp. NPDC057772 TaxID=3346245 RepID=UPI003671D113